MKRGKRIVGYLRVSTVDQDCVKNRHDVLSFANSHGFVGKVEFIEEKISGMVPWRKRKLAELVDGLNSGDVLIVPELSRIGRSIVEVLDVLNTLKDKSVAVYSVKEGFKLNGDDLSSKILSTLLALFSSIERDLISQRTREGLQAAKLAGKLLGRPRGPGKSRLDVFRPEIEALLKNGSRQSFIAARYKVTSATLSNWIKKNGIEKGKP